ncbi:MAG: hypothetical protein K2X87_22915 [Gemmataceae bacterium]|nr:hypothetical protein [Gemmataceae bacterium]
MRLALMAVMVGAAGAAGWAATLAVADPPRKFGPEWTLIGGMYERAVVVRVSHHPGGNVSGYTVPLEDGAVRIWEVDGGLGHTLVSDGHGEFKVQKDGQGKAVRFTVWLKGCRYFDIDADGMVDAVYDNRDGRDALMILLDGRLVRVRNQDRAAFQLPVGGNKTAEGFDTGVKYEFEKGAWRVADPK